MEPNQGSAGAGGSEPLCPYRGRAASVTSGMALLPQGARQAGKRRTQCARFRPKGAAEGSLRTSGLRRRATEGKCAFPGVERRARPGVGSVAKRPKPPHCRPQATCCPCAVETPAPCSRRASPITYKASSTHTRSRAKRGEGFPTLCWVG